jgi:EmrB/QacA subfamily drug resistance transporter
VIFMDFTQAFSSISANPNRRRWTALAVVCLGQLMMILDGSIVNIALPKIQSDLHFSSAALTWVPNAYLISFGSFLLLGGRLGDLLGRARMFVGGMVIFTLASIACGVAESAALLDVARFIQGFGAAIAAPAILALIVVEFPEPDERARTIGIYTFVSVAGASIGLILGGVLTQALSWHWIFFINVPIGILALGVGVAVLDLTAGRGLRGGIDVIGSALATLGVMLAIYAVVTSEADGVASAKAIVPFVAGLAMLAAFFAHESRTANPILPPRILQMRALIVTCVVRALMVVAMFTTFYLCSLFLEQVSGFDPIVTGLAFLPQTVAVAIFALGVTRRLTDRFGQLPVMFAGMGFMVAGPVIIALTLDGSTSYVPWLLIPFLLIGIGGGMSFVSLMHLGLAGVPNEDAGIASGLINVSQQIGSAAGIAVLGTIAASRTGALEARGVGVDEALAGGFSLSFWLLAAVAAGGIVLAGRYLRRGAKDEAHPDTVPASGE